MNYINSFNVDNITYPVTGIRYNSSSFNLYTINTSISADNAVISSNICVRGSHTISSASGIIVSNIFIGPTIQYADSNDYMSHTGNITIGGLPILGSLTGNYHNGSLNYDNIFIGGGAAWSGANTNVFLGGGVTNGCVGKLFIEGGSYDSTYTSEATTFLPGSSNFLYTKVIDLPGSYAIRDNVYYNSGAFITTIPGDKTTVFHIEAFAGIYYASQTICWLVSSGTNYGIHFLSGVSYTCDGFNPTGRALYVYNGSNYYGSSCQMTGGGGFPNSQNIFVGPFIGIRDFNTAGSTSNRDDVAGLYMFAPDSTISVPGVTVRINQIVFD